MLNTCLGSATKSLLWCVIQPIGSWWPINDSMEPKPIVDWETFYRYPTDDQWLNSDIYSIRELHSFLFSHSLRISHVCLRMTWLVARLSELVCRHQPRSNTSGKILKCIIPLLLEKVTVHNWDTGGPKRSARLALFIVQEEKFRPNLFLRLDKFLCFARRHFCGLQ